MSELKTKEFEEFLLEIPNIDIKSPAVTFGTIFKHEHKENFISDWLAYLLNADNTGTNEPLEVLIKIALKEEYFEFDFSEVTIQREYVFSDDKRRIDFLITTPSHIIGIENKIWSGLQEKQLCDYSKQINKIKEKMGNEVQTLLILLCPDGNSVKNEISNDFKLVTYDDLIEEFKKIRLNCLGNLRASVLMEDFITHVEAFFMNDINTDLNFDFIKFQNDNQAKIEKLNKNIKESKEQFKVYFKKEIEKSGFNNDTWQIITKDASDYFVQIYKDNWNNGNTHFEFLKEKKDFPPSEITVDFHVEGSSPYNAELKNLKKSSFEKKVIKMNYDKKENFENSVKEVVLTLKEFDKELTSKIDSIFAK